MLPYGLAIAVGLSSSIFFLTAFFMPKIHRQDDFIWSGLGFFYALILWFCASQFTNSLLLGQLVVVALLISYSWQVMNLRQVVVSPGKQKNLDGFSLTGFIGGVLNRNPQAVNPTTEKVEEVAEVAEKTAVSEANQAPVETNEEAETDSFPIIPVTEDVAEENVVDDLVNAIKETSEEPTPEAPESEAPEPKEDIVIEKDDTIIQAEESNIVSASEEDSPVETITAAESESESSQTVSETTEKKPGLFNKLFKFGNKEQKSEPKNKPSIINTKLDELLDDEEEEAVNSEEVPTAISEPPIEEPEVEEETNWDFLDDEAEATPEETTNLDPGKPKSEEESN